MDRVKFEKGSSHRDDLLSQRPQREFIQFVLFESGCPSLRELINRGFDINYSTLKNYFNESRLLPLDLFESLCEFAKVDKNNFNFEVLQSSWGQVKGGKKSRKHK